MNAQRILALLMIGLQAATIRMLANDGSWALYIAGVAVIPTFTSVRIPISKTQLKMLAIACVVVLIVRSQMSGLSESARPIMVRTPLTVAICDYLVLMQVLLLFQKRPHDQPALYLPGIAVGSMATIALVQISELQRQHFQYMTLAFAAALAGYLHSSGLPTGGRLAGWRVRHLLAGIFAVAVVVGVAWAGAFGLYRCEPVIENFMAGVLDSPSAYGGTGFSSTSDLWSVTNRREIDAKRMALRIYSEQMPAYIRVNAFDNFLGDLWATSERSTAAGTLLLPSADPGLAKYAPTPNAAGQFFVAETVESAQWRAAEIWVESNHASYLPTILDTTCLRIDAVTVRRSRLENFLSSKADLSQPYTVFAARDRPPIAPSGATLDGLLKIRDRDRRRLQDIADSIFKPEMTATERVVAVNNFLGDGFTYVRDSDEGFSSDPLHTFLRTSHAGHCELFASAATILLRLGGVPTRYVNGYLVNERNGVGRYWVARNRDAHAWCEAFDPRQGWVIVDPTPEDVLPEISHTSSYSQLSEVLTVTIRQFIVWLQEKGLESIARVGTFLIVMAPYLILTTLVGIPLGFGLRVLWRRPRKGTVRPEVLALHRLLVRVDRLAARWQISRLDGETLHQFANRLEATEPEAPAASELLRRCAEWYRAYADIRYGMPTDSEAISRLRQTVPVAGGRRR